MTDSDSAILFPYPGAPMRRPLFVRSALVLALVAAASPASAQLAPVPEMSHQIALNPAGLGVYRDTELGDFDGDGLLDVVTRRNDAIEGLLGVVALGFSLPEVSPSACFVVRPVTPGADTLVISNGTGLHELSYDVGSGTWTSAALLTDPSGSQAARDLALRSVASPGDPLVLVQSDGLSVQLLSTSFSASMGAPELVSTRPIRRVIPFDLDGDGGDELALLHTDGASVWDSSGTPPNETWTLDSTYSFTVPDVTYFDAVAGSAAGSAEEWLACIGKLPNGLNQSVAFVSNGATLSTVGIGQASVARFAAGDWNGDGNDDLVLSRRVDERVGVALHQGTSWHDFAGTLLFEISDTPGASSELNAAQPAVLDLNGDGDVDIALAVQSKRELHMELNQANDASDSAPVYLTAWDPDGPGLLDPFMNLVDPDNGNDLYVEFELTAPATWPLVENGSEVPLELVVHNYGRLSSGGAPQFVDSWESGTALTSTSPDQLVNLDTDEAPGYTTPTYEHYFFVARYVRKVNGEITYSSQPLVVGYHVTGDSNYVEGNWTGPGAAATNQLETWGGSGAVIDVYYDSGDGQTTGLPSGNPTGSVDPVGGRVGLGMPLMRMPQS